jgi:hypothetical protein
LFAFIGFPHAEDVTIRATRRVAHDDHPAFEHAMADDAYLAAVLPCVFDLQCDTCKDFGGISEVQSAFRQRLLAFRLIEREHHSVIVSTTTMDGKVVRGRWRAAETSAAGTAGGVRAVILGGILLRGLGGLDPAATDVV